MNYDFKNLVYDEIIYDKNASDKNASDNIFGTGDDIDLKTHNKGIKSNNTPYKYENLTLTLDKSCFEDIGIRINYSLFNEIGQIYNVIFDLGQNSDLSDDNDKITLSENFFNGKVFNKCTFNSVIFVNLFNSEFINCKFDKCIIKTNSFKRVTLCNMTNMIFTDDISIRSFNRTTFERTFLQVTVDATNKQFYNILETQNDRLSHTMIKNNSESDTNYYLIKSNLNLNSINTIITENTKNNVLPENLKAIITENFKIDISHSEELINQKITKRIRSKHPTQDRDSRNPELPEQGDWRKIYNNISISQNGNLISVIDNYLRKIKVKNVNRGQETFIEFEEDTRDANELNREDFMRYRWEKVLSTRFIYSGTVLVVIALVMRRGALDELVPNGDTTEIEEKLGMYKYEGTPSIQSPIYNYQKEYFYPYLQVEEIIYDVFMTHSSISVSYSQRNVFDIPELKYFVLNTEIFGKIPSTPNTNSDLYDEISNANTNQKRVTTEHLSTLYNDDFDNDFYKKLYRMPQYKDDLSALDNDIIFYVNSNTVSFDHNDKTQFFERKKYDNTGNAKYLKLNLAYNYTYQHYDLLVRDYGKLFINFTQIDNVGNFNVDADVTANPDNILIGEKEAGSQKYFYDQFHYIALRYFFERRVMEMIRKFVDDSYIEVTCSNSKEQFYFVLIRYLNPIEMTSNDKDGYIESNPTTTNKLFLSNTTNENIQPKINNFTTTNVFMDCILDMRFNFISTKTTTTTTIDVLYSSSNSSSSSNTYNNMVFTYDVKPYKISTPTTTQRTLKQTEKTQNKKKLYVDGDTFKLTFLTDGDTFKLTFLTYNDVNIDLSQDFKNASNIKLVEFAETKQEDIAIVVEYNEQTKVFKYSIFTISDIENKYNLELNESFDDEFGRLELYNMNLQSSSISSTNIFLRNIDVLYDYSTFKILEMSNIYLINTILRHSDYANANEMKTINNISFKQCVLEDIKSMVKGEGDKRDKHIAYENANNMYLEECILKTPIASKYSNITMKYCHNTFDGPLIGDGSSLCDVLNCYADGSHGTKGVHSPYGNSIFGKNVSHCNVENSYCKNSLFADLSNNYDFSNAIVPKTHTEIQNIVNDYCITRNNSIINSFCYEYLLPTDSMVNDYRIGHYTTQSKYQQVNTINVSDSIFANKELKIRKHQLRKVPSNSDAADNVSEENYKLFDELDYVSEKEYIKSSDAEYNDYKTYIEYQLQSASDKNDTLKTDNVRSVNVYHAKLKQAYEYRKYFNKQFNNNRSKINYYMINYDNTYFDQSKNRHPFSHVLPKKGYLEKSQEHIFQNMNLSYMNFDGYGNFNENTNFKGTTLYDVTSNNLIATEQTEIIKLGKNTDEEGKYQIIKGVLLGKGVNVSHNQVSFIDTEILGIELDNDTDLTKTVFKGSYSSGIIVLNNGIVGNTSGTPFPSYGHTRVINGHIVGDGVVLDDANLTNGDLSDLILLDVKMNNNTNLTNATLMNTRVNPGYEIKFSDNQYIPFVSDEHFPSYPHIMVKKGVLFGKGVDLRYDYYTLSYLTDIEMNNKPKIYFDLSGVVLDGGINLSNALINDSTILTNAKLNDAEGENIRYMSALDSSNNLQLYTSYRSESNEGNVNNNSYIEYKDKIYIINGYLIGNGVNLKSKSIINLNLNNVVFYKMNLYGSVFKDCDMIGTKFYDCYVEYNEMTYNKVRFDNTPKVINTEMSFTNIITDPKDSVVNQITKSNQNAYQNISEIVWKNIFGDGNYNFGKIYFQNAKFGNYSQKIIYFHFKDYDDVYNLRLMIFDQYDKLVLLYKKDNEIINVATTIELKLDSSLLNDESRANISDEMISMKVKYNTINSVIITTKDNVTLYYLYTQNPTYYIQYKPYSKTDNELYKLNSNESLHGFVYHIHKKIYMLYFREPLFNYNDSQFTDSNNNVSKRYYDYFILKTYDTNNGAWNPIQKFSKDNYNFYVITKSSVLQKNNGVIIRHPIQFERDVFTPITTNSSHYTYENPYERINGTKSNPSIKFVAINNSHSKNNVWKFTDNSGNTYEHYIHHVFEGMNESISKNNIYIQQVKYSENSNEIIELTFGNNSAIESMKDSTGNTSTAGNIAYGLIRNNSSDEDKRMDYVFMDTTNLNVYTTKKLPYYIDETNKDISGNFGAETGISDIQFKNTLPVSKNKYLIDSYNIDMNIYKYYNYEIASGRKMYCVDEMKKGDTEIVYLHNDASKRITLKKAFSHQVHCSLNKDDCSNTVTNKPTENLERIYFIPYDENFIGIYDNTNNRNELGGFTIDVNGPGKYSYGVIVNKYDSGGITDMLIYLIPFNADHVGIFSIFNNRFTKLYVKSELLNNDLQMAGSYSSGVLIRSDDTKEIDKTQYIYLVPYNASYFTYIDTNDNSFNLIFTTKYEEEEKFKTARYIHNNQILLYVPYNYNSIMSYDLKFKKLTPLNKNLPVGTSKFSSIYIYEYKNSQNENNAQIFLLPGKSKSIYYFKYNGDSPLDGIEKNIVLPDSIILQSKYENEYSFGFHFDDTIYNLDSSYNKVLSDVYMIPKSGNDLLKLNMEGIHSVLDSATFLSNVNIENHISIVKVNNIIQNYNQSFIQGITFGDKIILTPYNYNHIGYIPKTNLENSDTMDVKIIVDYTLKQTTFESINVKLNKEYTSVPNINLTGIKYDEKTQTNVTYRFSDYPEPTVFTVINKSLEKARDSLRYLMICHPISHLKTQRTFDEDDYRNNDDNDHWEKYYNWSFTYVYGSLVGGSTISNSLHKQYPFKSFPKQNLYERNISYNWDKLVFLLAHPLETFITDYVKVPFSKKGSIPSQIMYYPRNDNAYGNGYTNWAEELYTYIAYDTDKPPPRFYPPSATDADISSSYPLKNAKKLKDIKEQLYIDSKNLNITYSVTLSINGGSKSYAGNIEKSHNFLKTTNSGNYIYSLYKDVEFYNIFINTEDPGIYNLYITDVTTNVSKSYKIRLHKITDKVVTRHDYINKSDNMSKLDKEYEIIPFHTYMYFKYLTTNFTHTKNDNEATGSYTPKMKCLEDFLLIKKSTVAGTTTYSEKQFYVPLTCEDITCMEIGVINENIHTLYIGTELGFIQRYNLDIESGGDTVIYGETIYGYGICYNEENMKLFRELSADEFQVGNVTLSLKDTSILDAYNGTTNIEILHYIKGLIDDYYEEKYNKKTKDVVLETDSTLVDNTLQYFFSVNINLKEADSDNETKLKKIKESSQLYFQQEIVQSIAEVLIMSQMIYLSDVKKKNDIDEIIDKYTDNYDMNQTNIIDIYKKNFAYRYTKYPYFLNDNIKTGHSMYNDYVRYKMIYEYYRFNDITYNVDITSEVYIGIKDTNSLKDLFEQVKNEIWDHPIPHYVGKSMQRNSWTPESINFHLTSTNPYIASDVYQGDEEKKNFKIKYSLRSGNKTFAEQFEGFRLPLYEDQYSPQNKKIINKFPDIIDSIKDNPSFKNMKASDTNMKTYLLMRTSENFKDSSSYDKEYGLSAKYLKTGTGNIVNKIWDEDWRIGNSESNGSFNYVSKGSKTISTYNELYFRLPIVNIKSKLDNKLTNFAIFNIKHLGDQVIAVYKNKELFTMDTIYRKTLYPTSLVNTTYQSKILFPKMLPYLYKTSGDNPDIKAYDVVYDDILGGMQNKIQRFNHYYFDNHITQDFQQIPYLALLRSLNGEYENPSHISLYKFEKPSDVSSHERTISSTLNGVEISGNELINEDVMYNIKTIESGIKVPSDYSDYVKDNKELKMFSFYSNVQNENEIEQDNMYEFVFVNLDYGDDKTNPTCYYRNYSLVYNINENTYKKELQEELEIELTKDNKLMFLNGNTKYLNINVNPVTKNNNYDYYNYQYNYEYHDPNKMHVHVGQHVFRPLEITINTFDTTNLNVSTLITFPKYSEWYKNIHNNGISIRDTMLFFSGGLNDDYRYLIFEYNHANTSLHVMDISISYLENGKIENRKDKILYPLSIKRENDTIVHLLPLKTLNIDVGDEITTTELFTVVFKIENEGSDYVNVKELRYDTTTVTRKVPLNELIKNINFLQIASEYIYIKEFNSIFSIPQYSNKMIQFKLDDITHLVENIFIHDVSTLFTGIAKPIQVTHYYYESTDDNDIANEYYASYYSSYDKLLYLAPYKSSYFASLDMSNVSMNKDNQIIHEFNKDSKHFKIDISSKIDAMESKNKELKSNYSLDPDNKVGIENKYNLYATRLTYHNGAFYMFSHYYNSYVMIKMNGLMAMENVKDRFEFVKVVQTPNSFGTTFASSDIGNDKRKALYDDTTIELDEAPKYFEDFKYYTTI